MKIVIIGRASTGKSALAKALADNGLNLLRIRTTRPLRTYDPFDAEEHTFLALAEANAILPDQRLLFVAQDGYSYFTTREDLDAADICILTPEQLELLAPLLPDDTIRVVHCTYKDKAAYNQDVQDRILGSAQPVDASNNILARQASEDAVFKSFEARMAANDLFGFENLYSLTYENNGKQQTLDDMVQELMMLVRRFENLRTIAQQVIDLGHIQSSKPGCVDAVYDKPARHVRQLPLDFYVDTVLYSEDNLTALFRAWLSHEQAIGVPPELDRKAIEDEDAHDTDFEGQISIEEYLASLDAAHESAAPQKKPAASVMTV